VHAPASVVYRLIADYRDGHPRIVPPEYFSNLIVEQGGYGAGTRISFDMTVLGQTQHATAVIEEPQPGRVLVERYADKGAVTIFEVVPAGEKACDVTIATEMPRTGGVRAAVERFIIARLFPRIYRAELARINDIAAART
jgi:hypothetical protein